MSNDLHDAEPFLLFSRAAGSITHDASIRVLILSGLLSLFLVLTILCFSQIIALVFLRFFADTLLYSQPSTWRIRC